MAEDGAATLNEGRQAVAWTGCGSISAGPAPRRHGMHAQVALALGPVALVLATGCGSESAFSIVAMSDGMATYQSTAAGLAVSGSFTLTVDFYNDEFEYGDETDVYLHRLQLGRYDQFQLDDGPDVDEVAADAGLPFVVTVGSGSKATITWSTLVDSHEPSRLCDSKLLASVYLSLTDEIALCTLYADDHYHPGNALSWTPDPCQ
jgi:hypothetical protein